MFQRRSIAGEQSPREGVSRLQAVFGKLAGGVLPPRGAQGVLGGSPKIMTSDIIESVLADTPVPTPPNYNYYDCFVGPDDNSRGLCLALPSLSQRLETALRLAKKTDLSCGEVLLPCGLLYRISRDVVSMAESEPYGIRGCLLHINFEGPPQQECRKLSSIKCDPGTATTFELNLTLKQNSTGWAFIPQFIKNLARGGTIVISPAYTLSKKKLYRSIAE